MAKAEQPGKATQTRRITVCSKGFERLSGQRWVFFPIISLSGKWLQDSGFKIGHTVDIACEDGKLTITLSKEQRYADS
ncbi:MAG TPA: SymE family type I addiction module toxin [Edaphocola sp.]|nr:SymE family type I addiction module toxin [Edaphocola sp.]